MKVRLYGFSLAAGHTKASLSDLYDRLTATTGAADNSRTNERRIYFAKDADPAFARGLVVTVKDQKKFCKLIEDHGRLVINVENLQGDDKLMEFNFFVINKANGVGLYQQYHHSCSIGVFGGYLQDHYRMVSEGLANQKVDALTMRGEHTESKEKAIRRAHKGRLSVAVLFHRGTLATVLRQFQKIKAFEYEFAQLQAIRSVAQPLQNYVKRRKETVTFEPRFAVGTIATAVQNAVNAMTLRTGRVHVETTDGDPLSVKLAEIPEHFGEYEYDDVAEQLNNLDTAQFAQHQTFNELQAVCNSDAYRHIFNARVRQ